VLTVRETNNPWSDGGFGAVLRDELMANGTFRRVYFPAGPPDSSLLRLTVDSVGSHDGHEGWENFASNLTGAFLMLPSAFMPFFEDFELRCRVTVEDEGRVLRSFEVVAQRGVTHALFAKRISYLRRVRAELYREVAHLIAAELQSVESMSRGWNSATRSGDSP
jgi:hypothetical protein